MNTILAAVIGALFSLFLSFPTYADDFNKIVQNNPANPEKDSSTNLHLEGLDIPEGYEVSNFLNYAVLGDNECISFSLTPKSEKKKLFVGDLSPFLKKNFVLTLNQKNLNDQKVEQIVETKFSGVVTEAGYQAPTGNYKIRGCSKLSLMNFNTQSQLFVNKTPIEIISTLLSFHDIDFIFDLKTKFVPKEFVTQYNETDYNFFRRLVEENGLFYVVRFADNKPTHIFLDSPETLNKYNQAIAYKNLNVRTSSSTSDTYFNNAADTLSIETKIETDNYLLSDYNMFTNEIQSVSSLDKIGKFAQREYQTFDYNTDMLKNLAKTKLSAFNSQTNLIQITVNNPNVAIGDTTDIGGRKYLIIGSNLSYNCNIYLHEDPKRCDTSNTISLIPEKTGFASPLTTTLPQASTMIGFIADNEADDKGRLGIQYPWMDKNSNIMYRALPTESVKKMGLKKGDRVIINFINGHLDKPIIADKI